MKRPLAVGDRVAVYLPGKRKVGKIVAQDKYLPILGIDVDNEYTETVAHPKQCRRLVKRLTASELRLKTIEYRLERLEKEMKR